MEEEIRYTRVFLKTVYFFTFTFNDKVAKSTDTSFHGKDAIEDVKVWRVPTAINNESMDSKINEDYDELQNAKLFQEALFAWRNSKNDQSEITDSANQSETNSYINKESSKNIATNNFSNNQGTEPISEANTNISTIESIDLGPGLTLTQRLLLQKYRRVFKS